MDNRQLVIVVAGVAVLLSGCLSGNTAGQTQSSTATPTATPTPTETTTHTAENCANWVSFYGPGSPGETAWEPDRIAVGYTVPTNASVFFVAFEEGTVIGTTHVRTTEFEDGVTAGDQLVEAGPRRINFSSLQYRPGPVVTDTDS